MLEIQNAKLQETNVENYKEILALKKDKIFGIETAGCKVSRGLSEKTIKKIIKDSGSSARTLFDISYKVKPISKDWVKSVVAVFDEKRSIEENPALHFKAQMEATNISDTAFGIARIKDKYFNIFIDLDKKLYVIVDNKILPYSEENKFTQYWI
jgi:ethanolamine utilization protein EutQ (cupin superfamily)